MSEGQNLPTHTQPTWEEEVIDLRQYLKVIKKWRKMIALITALSVATSAILSFFILPPVYEAKSILLVKMAADSRRTVTEKDSLESVVSTLTQLPQMTMNTYVGQVKSDIILERVIKKLELQQTYNPASLAKIVTASTTKDSNLIEIKVRHTDPQLAAKINNTLTAEYLELISEKNQEQMNRALSFLNEQKAAAEKEAQKAEEELKKFEAQPRSVVYLEKEFNLKSQSLAQYQSNLAQAEIELQQLRAGAERLQESLAHTPRTITVRRIDQEGKPYSSEELNPAYDSIASRLSEKRMQVAEKEAQVNALRSLVANLTGEVNDLQAEMAAKKTEKDKLEKEVTRLRNTVNLLAEKISQTQIAKSMDLGNTSVVVVSPAMVPTVPVKPNKKLNIAVAAVLGLMLGVILAFTREHLDNTIKTPEDVAQHLELPVLGMIPSFNSHRR